MIARPKMSRNEWEMTEIGAFEGGNVAPFSCPGGHAPWTYCAQALKAPTKDRGGEFRSGMTDAREKAIARDISNIFCG